MKTSLAFRSWFYFRMGWSTYFVFFLGAVNTLTITYFLAIDNYPVLKNIFPTFEQYVAISMFVGIPMLVMFGYAHYKKTKAYKSEIDVLIESNPYLRRNTVNAEISIRLNMKLLALLLKLSKKEQLDKTEYEEIQDMQKTISNFMQKRSFANDMDMEFITKDIKKI
jgi:hypothetical protein